MKLCMFYRQRLASCVDAGHVLSAGLQRHLVKCPECRQFHERELFLARSLAGSAHEERTTPSPLLQSRIMAAVDQVTRPKVVRYPLPRLVWATGLAVALVLVFRTFHHPVPSHPNLAAPDVSVVVREFAALERNLPNSERIGQWGGELDEPLDREMRSLYHDARGAAQALVYNFLPDGLVRPSTDGAGGN